MGRALLIKKSSNQNSLYDVRNYYRVGSSGTFTAVGNSTYLAFTSFGRASTYSISASLNGVTQSVLNSNQATYTTKIGMCAIAVPTSANGQSLVISGSSNVYRFPSVYNIKNIAAYCGDADGNSNSFSFTNNFFSKNTGYVFTFRASSGSSASTTITGGTEYVTPVSTSSYVKLCKMEYGSTLKITGTANSGNPTYGIAAIALYK